MDEESEDDEKARLTSTTPAIEERHGINVKFKHFLGRPVCLILIIVVIFALLAIFLDFEDLGNFTGFSVSNIREEPDDMLATSSNEIFSSIDIVSMNTQVEHVDGHVDQIRLSFGESEDIIFLHFTIVSAKISCLAGNMPDTSFHGHFPRRISTQFPQLGLIFSFSNQRRSMIPDFNGCFNVPKDNNYFFFVAGFNNLPKNSLISYQIGLLTESKIKRKPATRSFKLNKKENPGFLILGDTGTDGIKEVSGAVNSYIKSNSHAKDLSDVVAGVIHVGDQSYASNNGDCFSVRNGGYDGNAAKTELEEKQEVERCSQECSLGMKCSGRSRISAQSKRKWDEFLKFVGSFMEKVPWMTTMGNHDNDLFWFYKYRPPHDSSFTNVAISSSFPHDLKQRYIELFSRKENDLYEHQAIVNDILNRPYFYSFTNGMIKFIALGTEDNSINAYEMNQVTNGSMPYKYYKRFEEHFGKNSPQYRWLEEELKNADRKKTPWIVLFTHRPLFQTSSHHAMCSIQGDWFGCHFRNLYTELFEQYKVNIVISGHSHHYQRSKPMKNSFDYKNNKPLVELSKVKRNAMQTNSQTGIKSLPNSNEMGRSHPQEELLQMIPNNLRPGRRLKLSALNRSPIVEEGNPIYMVVGTGGYKMDRPFSISRAPSWIAFRQSTSYGFARFEIISATELKWEYIAARQLSQGNIQHEIIDSTIITRSL